MLGDILYELNDIKIISQRIIEEDPNGIRIESTIYASSNFRGKDITETTTFWTMPIRSNNNVLYGEANGVLMTKDRQGLATFRGRGLTFKLGNDRIKDRGCRIYSTTDASETNKLSYLNSLVGLFEYDIDESGRRTLRIWEWK
ncbi:MAG: hypothetical protein M3297_02215 [Thermoproteota archaeon]|nr:hypothetical protein [Thermoproteota archaeon]